MAAVDQGRGLENRMEEAAPDDGGDGFESLLLERDEAAEPAPRHRLPWIGALENPHLVPMVVVNDSGYLVPLWTASDLLRGCKYFWHSSQE